VGPQVSNPARSLSFRPRWLGCYVEARLGRRGSTTPRHVYLCRFRPALPKPFDRGVPPTPLGHHLTQPCVRAIRSSSLAASFRESVRPTQSMARARRVPCRDAMHSNLFLRWLSSTRTSDDAPGRSNFFLCVEPNTKWSIVLAVDRPKEAGHQPAPHPDAQRPLIARQSRGLEGQLSNGLLAQVKAKKQKDLGGMLHAQRSLFSRSGGLMP
jgi:hypothetical protein